MKLSLRQRQTTRTSLRLKRTLMYVSGMATMLIMGFLIYFNVGTPKTAKASGYSELIDSGSFIINMGIVPATTSNGLRPYGMVYDIINNYDTPVKWVFDQNKAKDAKDFTYNGVDYKGGPFIIPAASITSAIKTRITYWLGQGVQGIYTTSTFNAPVYSNLTSVPMVMIDTTSGKQAIIKKYFANAMMPTTSYFTGSTSNLTACFDVWVNPHGDPTWTTHRWLYDFATTNGAYIFSQCHATSVMEGVRNPVTPFQQLNFLTTNGLKCYSNNNCGPGITETHGGNPTAPFTTNYPGDPIMQFMGNISPALNGGSEDWYIPQSTGGWRPTTRRCVTTSDGVSPREGVLLAYGPAYGLSNAGWVMYESGHDLDGTGVSDIAAQRVFFNFLFFASARKALDLTASTAGSNVINVPDNGATTTVSVATNGGAPPYNYKWTSTNPHVKFGDDTKPTTTVNINNGNAPSGAKESGIITVKVNDACGKKNFLARPFQTNPIALPVVLSSFSANVNTENKVQLNWATASEKGNDYFTIERSADGKEFNELTRIKGAGNSNNLLRYSYLDKSPLNGNSYYRLIQTDYNGKSQTFKIVPVKVNASYLTGFKVYPNPFGSSFIAEFESTVEQPMEIQVINMQGLVMMTETIMAIEGRNNCRINMGRKINAGTYVVRLSNVKETFATLKVNVDD